MTSLLKKKQFNPGNISYSTKLSNGINYQPPTQLSYYINETCNDQNNRAIQIAMRRKKHKQGSKKKFTYHPFPQKRNEWFHEFIGLNDRAQLPQSFSIV